MDDAGRTNKWVEYEITVKAWIHNSTSSTIGTIDADMQDVRVSLTTPGGALRYHEKGFGTLSVNDLFGPTPRVLDARWGPYPRLLSFQPLGDRYGALVEWHVITRIPECPETAIYEKQLLMFNYSIDTDIDETGYTTLTTNVIMEIPMTRRLVNRTIPDHIDRYRELARPQIPQGFQRVSQRFKPSLDKTRLEATFVDKEIPAALPEGATAMDVKYSVSTDLRRGFIQYDAQLSGTVTVAAGQPKSTAWDKILLVLATKGRLKEGFIGKRLQGEPVIDGIIRPGAAPAAQKPHALMTSFRFEEDVFGRTSSFNVSWMIIGVRLQDIFAATHIWEPVQDATFSKWTTSLAKSAFNIRGAAGLTQLPQDDVILDLCTREKPRAGTTTTDKEGLGTFPRNRLPAPPPDGTGTFPRNRIPPESSWIRYLIQLSVWTDDRRIRHKVLPIGRQDLEPNRPDRPPVQLGRQEYGRRTDAPAENLPSTGSQRLILGVGGEANQGGSELVQAVSDPIYTLRMEGMAMRLEHRIPTPKVESIGSMKPIEVQSVVDEMVVGALAGIPVHQTRFIVDYILPKAPRGALPVPPNPALFTEGEQ